MKDATGSLSQSSYLKKGKIKHFKHRREVIRLRTSLLPRTRGTQKEALPSSESLQEINVPTPLSRNYVLPNLPNNVQLYKDQLQMNINMFSFIDDEGRARHPLVISRNIHDRVANISIGNNIMRQSPALNVCSTILQSIKNKNIFVSDALDTFYWKKFLRDTKSFATATTSCRFSI